MSQPTPRPNPLVAGQTIESQRGFSLLEVMIAVAIVAVALSALFASEVQAGKVGYVARNTNTAALLARCKMGEIEEQIAKEGFPAIDDRGQDECCEDAEMEGFSCEWIVERIELPDMGAEDEEGEGGPGGAFSDVVGDEDAQSAALDSALSGGMSSDGLSEMAISIAYPVLKGSLEEQVRRAEVKVKWNEGSREVSFDVVQYLVAEQANLPDEPTPTGGAPAAPSTGGGSSPGVRR